MHPVALLADSPVRYTWPSPPLWLSSLTFKHSSSLAMLYPGSLFFYRLPKICPQISKLHRLPSALRLPDRCAVPISGLSRTKEPLLNTPTPNVFLMAWALRNSVAALIRLAILGLLSADSGGARAHPLHNWKVHRAPSAPSDFGACLSRALFSSGMCSREAGARPSRSRSYMASDD